MMTSSNGQKRVMLWAVPRSLSTAMCRVMMNSGLNTEVLFEPYGDPFYMGPERPTSEYSHLDVIPGMTFMEAKKRQGMPYEVCVSADQQLFDSSQSGYKEQAEVARVLRGLGHRVVVLDAEDLMDNPEAALRAYCEAVGLDFCQSMLNWEPLSESEYQRVINRAGFYDVDWFNVMRSSSGIHRRPRPPTSLQNIEYDVITDPKIREALRKAEKEAMIYYGELYAMRLIV